MLIKYKEFVSAYFKYFDGYGILEDSLCTFFKAHASKTKNGPEIPSLWARYKSENFK
jgi:hypothetical protein